jgi:Tol biopolymer transport system component
MNRLIAALAVAAATLFFAVPASASYSGKNGRVAWHSGGDIYVTNAARSVYIRLKDGGLTSYSPALAPNGRAIAFSAQKPGFPAQLIVVPLPKSGFPGAKVKVSFPTKALMKKKLLAARHPTWSPNGKKLAFVCVAQSNLRYELCVIDLKTKKLKTLTHCDCTNIRRDSRPEWSPKGDRIAFSSGTQIYTVRAGGGGLKKILDPADSGGQFGSYWYPSWSPDGTKLLFSGDGVDLADVLVANADGSGRQVIFTESQDPDGANRYPAWAVWAPDGTRYLLNTYSRTTPEQLVSGTYADGVFGAPDTVVTEVTPKELNDPQPVWGPAAK